MNIILDMDGTLVSQPDTLPRPFLKEFLKYCFGSFSSVSIWTAASREHFDFVNKIIFQPILGEIKSDWNFVYTADKCSVKRTSCSSPYSQDYFYTNPSVIKPLKKVWLRSGSSGFTKHNTLIIDDNPVTYCQNYGNAIPIDTYDDQCDDRQLELLIKFLDKLKTIFDDCGTIRHVEKRYWFKI